MKKFLILLMMMVFSVSLCATKLSAQAIDYPPNSAVQTDEKTSISASDLKTLRRAVADKTYFEQRAKQYETSYNECRTNSEGWQNLYRAEKSRADLVADAASKQAAALKEKDLQFSNSQILLQDARLERDALKFEAEKLRGSRWKWAVVGFGAGFGVGGLTGNRLPRF